MGVGGTPVLSRWLSVPHRGAVGPSATPRGPARLHPDSADTLERDKTRQSLCLKARHSLRNSGLCSAGQRAQSREKAATPGAVKYQSKSSSRLGALGPSVGTCQRSAHLDREVGHEDQQAKPLDALRQAAGRVPGG